MISIGSVAPNSNNIAPIKGTVPMSATWDQYIPIVDETGTRLSLTNYEFELSFRDSSLSTVLTLSTVGGEILKTTDSDGDTLRVFASPDDLAGIDEGDYDCTFSAQNTSDQVWLLARGRVKLTDAPTAFT